ncbi:MAG: hypothetical protein IMZ61_02075 [Planctomycetes bacterium]|nr:hypothetical protein [Thermoplasmata archaeon]MBE3142696.1 hypothetical protein [Planctomycetota bacterium]
MASKMYEGVMTWNPLKGCGFSCTYCVPTFQRQAKRQKHNCMKCYNFEPHEHPERLTKIPNAKTVFVCGNGDISFCDDYFLRQIVLATAKKLKTTFYWQSKNPATLSRVTATLREFVEPLLCNHIMVTTLETNRDKDYHLISKAPPPTDRAYDFMRLPWHRKIVTIEPIMDFDHNEFMRIILDIKPELVYIGYNSKPGAVKLPEPTRHQTELLIYYLEINNVPVKTKFLPWENQ